MVTALLVRLVPPDMGSGLLIVWTDVAEAIAADFNEWYNREHLPDRILRMPGFLRGRRYAAVAGGPAYLTCYDLQDTNFMLSDAHTGLRRQRTERDRLFVPRFQNTIKGICDVAGRAGTGNGGQLVALPVKALPGHEQDFADVMCRDLLPALGACRGVASALFALRNEKVTQASSAKDDRSGDRYLNGLVVVEATSDEGVAAALAQLAPDRLSSSRAMADLMPTPCVLQLMFDLRAPAPCD